MEDEEKKFEVGSPKSESEIKEIKNESEIEHPTSEIKNDSK